jgi:hypothetical protein
MSLLTRVPAGGVLFAGLSVLLGALGLAAWGGWCDGYTGRSEFAEETSRGADLDRQARGYLHRLERRERVMHALLDGKVTLLEGAALFRALDHEPPLFHWGYFRTFWPGDTDEERHCHELIGFVYSVLSSTDQVRAEEVRDRLRAELCERLCDGPLELPDVDRIDFSLAD